jgi:hypothetical protein
MPFLAPPEVTVSEAEVEVGFQKEEIQFLIDMSQKYDVNPGSVIESSTDICELILLSREDIRNESKKDRMTEDPILVISKGTGEFIRFPASIILDENFPLSCLQNKLLDNWDGRNTVDKRKVSFNIERMNKLVLIAKKIEKEFTVSDFIRACLRLFKLAVEAKSKGGILGICIGNDVKRKIDLDFES